MLNEIVYDSFFDELEEIEKNAFLEEMQKEAGISQKIKSTVRGFKNLYSLPSEARANRLGKAVLGGINAQAKKIKKPLDSLSGPETAATLTTGALKGLWRSPTGRAALLTSGAVNLVATGALGAGGYGLYRLHKKKKEEKQKTKESALGLARGIQSLTKPGLLKRVGKMWRGGIGAGAKKVGVKPEQLGLLEKGYHGARGVLRTPTGKALLAGAGVATALPTAGYVAGRLNSPRPPYYS